MKPNITKEELKSLKLFSYYLQSYGIKRAVIPVIIDRECIISRLDNAYEFNDNYHSRSYAELYDAIEKTLISIVNNNDLIEFMEDCEDNYGEILFDINCVEKTLEASILETIKDTNYSSATRELKSLDKSMRDIFEEFFKEIKNETEIDKLFFEGSGDSGEINNETIHYVDVPRPILEYLYRWLEHIYSGWEINEGSQGKFIFNTNEKLITLEFGENRYVEKKSSIDFQIKF